MAQLDYHQEPIKHFEFESHATDSFACAADPVAHE